MSFRIEGSTASAVNQCKCRNKHAEVRYDEAQAQGAEVAHGPPRRPRALSRAIFLGYQCDMYRYRAAAHCVPAAAPEPCFPVFKKCLYLLQQAHLVEAGW